MDNTRNGISEHTPEEIWENNYLKSDYGKSWELEVCMSLKAGVQGMN